MVNLTMGTTSEGVFDPIEPIVEICERYGVWCHLDGCLGGTAIMLDSMKEKMIGMERADSFAWDPHKILVVPM
jgi:glutamate/tyrosine decarboxylase-like PLP-dependent enzyme